MNTAAVRATPVQALAGKWLVSISVSLGTLLATFSSSMLNIALPHLRGSLGASLQEATWVIASFAMANICVMPLTGFLSRRFGQKQVYILALCVFLVSSFLCGMTRSMPLLIVFRAFQGMGAGALLPTEQALLQQQFPSSQQGIAIAIASMTALMGPAAGPILGGLIVDYMSWPWVFLVNLPIGVLGLVMVIFFVKVPNEAREKPLAPGTVQRLDGWGLLLLPLSLSSMQFLLMEGTRWGWTEPGTVALALGVALGLLMFVFWEITTHAPIVRLSLFSEPRFFIGTALAAVLYSMLNASQYLFPLFMQEVLGFTATQAALALVSRVVVSAVATPLLGRFHNVLPPHVVLAVGTLAFAYSCIQMSAFTLETEASHIAGVVAVQGLGFSGIGVTLTTLTLSRTPMNQKVDASSLHTLAKHTGGSLGLTFFAAYLTRDVGMARMALVPQVVEGSLPLREYLQTRSVQLLVAGMEPERIRAVALETLEQLLERQASLLAFGKLFLLLGALFLAAVPLTFLLRSRKVAPQG
ncbi:DHA2 family efflux MFS transporter permease subunit [Myxococcus vastator]|uniref:DHA2 family efflux MFS transporter permease subunit n=1 Tax=Myxococcus vastator TaxID=2709664 RepID=UPI0013D582C0|nr:DHA2 family efflux MFS transporter permease subunit [Myxococcus vastator]